jgi:hypothetical protein
MRWFLKEKSWLQSDKRCIRFLHPDKDARVGARRDAAPGCQVDSGT